MDEKLSQISQVLFIAERYTEKLKSLDTLYNTDMSRIEGYEIILNIKIQHDQLGIITSGQLRIFFALLLANKICIEDVFKKYREVSGAYEY